MEDVHPVAKAITTVLALAFGVLDIWWVVIAFVGGRMPVIGVTTDGGLGFGLLWLFVLGPLAMTIAYWVFMLIALPVSLLLGPRGRS